MSTIRLILFDFGNVLAYIDFNEFWRTLGLLRPEEIAPYADGYKSWTHRYEIGFISTGEYLAGLHSIFRQRFSSTQLEQAFSNIILEPIDGMAETAKRVSHAHRTALVSNTNEIHFKNSLVTFEALHILHKHYLSYQLHVMKPAREFYEIIIKDQQLDPSEVLFIDDLDTNVDGAHAAGMHAVKFENLPQIQSTLKTLRILV